MVEAGDCEASEVLTALGIVCWLLGTLGVVWGAELCTVGGGSQ